MCSHIRRLVLTELRKTMSAHMSSDMSWYRGPKKLLLMLRPRDAK